MLKSLLRRKPKAKRAEKRAAAAQELLAIDGADVAVSVRLNARARRIVMRVHPATGEVVVTAPARGGAGPALAFARGETQWIARQLKHLPETGGVGARRGGALSGPVPSHPPQRDAGSCAGLDRGRRHPGQRPRRTCAAPADRFLQAAGADLVRRTRAGLCRATGSAPSAHYGARHQKPLGLLQPATAHCHFPGG